jgi:hypothetical protein
MPNYRVYYPVHYVALGEEGAASGTAFEPIHGLQSVNMTTTFNLEQVFELGQLDIYENIENLPNIEMTLEKVLDGYPLMYHLASPNATSKTLNGRTVAKADAVLSLFADTNESSTGTPLSQVYCSGMFINSVNYTLPVQGQCRESLTLVGNDKAWRTSGFTFSGHFNGSDTPASGVQRRQHVKMGNAAAGGSIWPTNIPGMTVVSSSGYNVETAGQFGAHLQDVTIGVNLGREDLLELGRLKPYYRYARFPTPVDCTINLLPAGNTPGDLVNASSDGNNLSNQPITVRLSDGTVFDLGTKNKLQSVTYSGGDTGGGPVTVAFAYQNFNKLDVISASDPAGLT